MYVTLCCAPEVTTFTLEEIVITPPLLCLLELVVHQISSLSSDYSFLRLYKSKALQYHQTAGETGEQAG